MDAQQLYYTPEVELLPMLLSPGRRVVATLALFALCCFTHPAWGQGKGKNGSDPVVTPVKYTVSTLAIEGFQSSYETNDLGIALCSVATSALSTPINTQAEFAIALVNIHTEEVTYVENLLTAPTLWTHWPEGVDSVSIGAPRINNRGTIAVSAYSMIGTANQLPDSYLLHPEVEITPEGEEVLRYRPEYLGIGSVLFVNDLNWIMGHDLNGTFIRKADATKIYLDTIGLPFLPGTAFDLNNNGLFNAETTHFDPYTEYPYTYDVITNSISFYDDGSKEGVYCKDWPGRTLNDHGVIAGEHYVYYQFTKRGKTQTGIRKVPAIIDPVSGLQIFDDPNNGEVQDRVVYINHQRKDNQSTLLAYTPKATGDETVWNATRDLWLKLPNNAGFHLYDALDNDSKVLWATFTIDYDFVKLLTPRADDLAVDNNTAPTICGVSHDGGSAARFWVCKPLP